jgi:xanthine dehydrogenase accessory factor
MTCHPTDDTAVLATATEWLAAGQPAALATVVDCLGSGPREIGAHMAVRADGAFAGSVSGGCVEAAVIAEAQHLLAGGRPRLLEYGIADEAAWSVGLACGGRIRVALARVDRAVTEAILAAAAGRVPAALACDPQAGTAAAVTAEDVVGPLALDAPTLARVRALAEADQTELLEDGLFVRAYGPPWRLVVVGAVHIAQALAPMAAAAGLEVTVLDPRRAFAAPARFAGIDLVCGWPDEALPGLGLDRRTALVTLAHDPRIDDAALAQALAAGCFYVGALGSRRSHAARLERLAGTSGTERIRAPVGLDIGARNPAEIAVAVLAETIAARRGKPGRDRS